MPRLIIVGGLTGFCVGLVGYGLKAVFGGSATVWNCALVVCGLVGLLGIWACLRRLRKGEN